MRRIVTKNVFIKMFENPTYRKKLDQIILSFFKLDANIKLSKNECIGNNTLLEFIVFLNTEYLLKIVVVDNQNIFKESQTFYINISYRDVEKHYELLMPCYWEIYSPYSLKNPNKDNKLILFAGIFSCKSKIEVKNILYDLEIFKENEINDLLSRFE